MTILKGQESYLIGCKVDLKSYFIEILIFQLVYKHYILVIGWILRQLGLLGKMPMMGILEIFGNLDHKHLAQGHFTLSTYKHSMGKGWAI